MAVVEQEVVAVDVSCPGKVLVAGGYAILERPNEGVVISTSARFHTSCTWVSEGQVGGHVDGLRIHVNSPQYKQEIDLIATENQQGQLVLKRTGGASNKYVEKTIGYAVASAVGLESTPNGFAKLVKEHVGEVLQIELKADNDFYSQQARLKERQLPYTTESLESIQPFLPCVDESGQVAKTGLGSSAAMVTSVVTAIIKILAPSYDCLSTKGLTQIHAVAQFAHGVIQGKIGSGFDVCAAVYGSMRFVRYDPGELKQALDAAPTDEVDGLMVIPKSDLILGVVDKFNHSVECFQLPPRLELMCGDVCGGSETPSMSRKVMAWRKSAPEEEIQLWNNLIQENKNIAKQFETINELYENNASQYNDTLDAVVEMQNWWDDENGQQNPVLAGLINIRAAFIKTRQYLKKIGELAGVPIEPACQTELCDASMNEKGVIACGVPGAGGFDAIYAIVINSKRKDVEEFWSKRDTCALLLAESKSHPGIVIKEHYSKNH